MIEVNGKKPAAFSQKLWVYTNFDCNLRCNYCVAESTPSARRRALGLENVRRLVDEATTLGFERLFLTGGEPLVLDEIYDMIAYAGERMPTTLLTNAMLVRGRRLEQLRAVASENLTVQVSLDGPDAASHDAYRGQGTWTKTVAGIQTLLEHGFHVTLSTTETPVNSDRLAELHVFRRRLGIADEDHFIRPLARRGFAKEGIEVGMYNLVPELTVTSDGIYWHPLISPRSSDMRVCADIFPLSAAVDAVQAKLAQPSGTDSDGRTEFT